MKEVTVEVGFTTSVMGEVSQIKLQFSEEDLTQIREQRMHLMKNPHLFKVVMLFDGELLDADGEKADFRDDGGELSIFKEKLFYFTSSRYDGTVQIESQEILLEDLFTEDELDDDYRSTLTCDICASDVNLCECKEMTVDNARKFLEEKGYFTKNLWSDTDIIDRGNFLGHELDEDDAQEIFGLMNKRLDCEIGINWDFIDMVIEEYVNS